MKKNGRFYSLMSWDLRDYFVFTEYLVKTYTLPLFDSLTMGDDQTSVLQKMLRVAIGQGYSNYLIITLANHVDY